MESSRNTFEYEPLNASTHEIRLLLLQPTPKTDVEDQVHCNLFSVSLDNDTPIFEALSYIWGDPTPTELILLNSIPFKITQTLFTALRYLRLEDRPRILWADAICINQKDIPERGQQVGLMSRIYKSALRGLLWMDVSDEAIKHILPLLEHDYDEEVLKGTNLAFNLLHSAGTAALEELYMLFANPVWGRSWIVQELVLAPAVHVCIPNKSFDAKNLQYLALAVSKVGSGYFIMISGLQPALASNLFSNSWKVHCSWALRRSAEAPSILQTWHFLGACQSTDPRDRIYALLNIINNTLGIVPDYNITAEELFCKVVRNHICKTKNLDVLCLGFPSSIGRGFGIDQQPDSQIISRGNGAVNSTEESLGSTASLILPSWAPDFSHHGLPPTTFVSLVPGSRYKASKSPSDLDFGEVESFMSSTTLTLSGILVDRVGPIINSMYESHDTSGHDSIFVQSIPRSAYPTKYFTGEDSLDAFWRTNILDKSNRSNRLRPEEMDGYRNMAISIMQTILGPALNKLQFLCPVKRIKYQTHKTDEQNAINVSGFKIALENSADQRFCITQNAYMAMLPRYAREGDTICVFYGSQVPHVLRQAPGTLEENFYTVVGVAYVHGFMDGEAVELCSKGLLKESKFYLL